MATTFTTFYQRYRDMSVTGVTNVDIPPMMVNTAKFPCKWVHTCSIAEAPMRAKAVGGDRILRCTVVVVTGAMGQDTQGGRWSTMLAMVDTLNSAIKTASDRTTQWEVAAVPNYADEYLAVVAEIEQPERTV